MPDVSGKQVVARPVRTAAQLTVAAAVTEATDAFLFDMDERQYAAALALLTILFGFIQNLIELLSSKGWFLRNVEGKHAE